MIYPGTAPFGNNKDPNSLDQRKQQLLQQMASGGIRNNLSFGGSMGDAPGRSPSLSFNPFFAALQHALGSTNAGQANNPVVSGHQFFGGGQPQAFLPPQNIGSNGVQAAAVSTGAASGSAGIGGVAGSPAAAPSVSTPPSPSAAASPSSTPAPNPIMGNLGGVSNPLQALQTPSGATLQLFGLPPGYQYSPSAPTGPMANANIRPIFGAF